MMAKNGSSNVVVIVIPIFTDFYQSKRKWKNKKISYESINLS